MAKARMLNRSIATDKRLNRMSPYADWIYVRTIPFLDRDGIINGDPDELAATVCPWRLAMIVDEMPAIIDEWVNSGLVIRYQSGRFTALYFCGFGKNQRIEYDKEAPSKFNPPPGTRRTKKGLDECVSDENDNGNSPSTRRVLLDCSPSTRPLSISKDQYQDQENTTTPTPPTENSDGGGGGGGDSPSTEILIPEENTGTNQKSGGKSEAVALPPVTGNSPPPVATPPPEPIEVLGRLLAENGFGDLKPATRPQVDGWLSKYTEATIKTAIQTAAANGKTSLNYIEGVLKGNGKSAVGKEHRTGFGNFGQSSAKVTEHASNSTSNGGGYARLSEEEKRRMRAERDAEDARIRAEMAAERMH